MTDDGSGSRTFCVDTNSMRKAGAVLMIGGDQIAAQSAEAASQTAASHSTFGNSPPGANAAAAYRSITEGTANLHRRLAQLTDQRGAMLDDAAALFDKTNADATQAASAASRV